MKDQRLYPLFLLTQSIRTFFTQNGFLDIITPPMVKNPGIETHIHPFEVVSAANRKTSGSYLHTSPEFHMKELLSWGYEKIFTLGYCFRDENKSPIHRQQFVMLEWYRANSRYESIMEDCEKLLAFCVSEFKRNGIAISGDFLSSPFCKMTVQELFFKFLSVDILSFLEIGKIKKLLLDTFPEAPCPAGDDLAWDDYFFLLFLNKIEPRLKEIPLLILYEYPYHLSALSTIKATDSRVCERFEIYIHGVEIGNCFNELCDINIQKERFHQQHAAKKKLYGYSLPTPQVLFNALERGLPPSAGIAVGVERLMMALTGRPDL